MLTGVYAARNIAGEKLDVWAVNTEKEYLEEDHTEISTSGDRLVPVGIIPRVSEAEDSAEVILETIFAKLEIRNQKRRLNRLQSLAHQMGYSLVQANA